MKKIIYVLLALFLSSCSKVYYVDNLKNEYNLLKSIESSNSIIINNIEYNPPVKVTVHLKSGKSLTGSITKVYSKGFYLEQSDQEKGIIERTSLKEIIVSESETGKEIKGPKVYFSEQEVENKFEVTSLFHYKFFAFGPVWIESKLRKSLIPHIENCEKNKGDAIIVSPDLITSRVLKLK
jgi:hypothetical protein